MNCGRSIGEREGWGGGTHNVVLESSVLCYWQLCVDKRDGDDPKESKCCQRVWSVNTRRARNESAVRY
jgi:hypothetical protein